MIYLTRYTVKFNFSAPNPPTQSSEILAPPNWTFVHPQLNHDQFLNLKSFKGLLQALLLNSNMMVFYLKTWRENSYLVLIYNQTVLSDNVLSDHLVSSGHPV